MIRLLPVAALFLIAACATSSTQPSQAESAQAMNSGGDGLVGQNAASGDSAAIEDIDAPDAPKTPTEEMPHVQAGQPGVVCEKVVKTGSIMPTTVCRRKADIERRGDSDRKLYEDIKRNTTLGADGI